jgi:hypothetical protein
MTLAVFGSEYGTAPLLAVLSVSALSVEKIGCDVRTDDIPSIRTFKTAARWS